MKFVASVIFLAIATSGTLLTAGPVFTFQSVTDPTGNNVIQLLGINNAGTIAGFDDNNPALGFTLALPNNFTAENYPASASTMVTGINQNGSTVGIYVDAANNTHGFTDIGGTFQTVDNPASAIFNQGLGINDSNTTVGYYAPTQAGQTGQIAYSQAGGTFTDVNALLPSNVNSQAVGINDAGNIVGFYMPTGATSIGFTDFGGAIGTVDPFSSTFTQALGINDLGEIVGVYTDAGGDQFGYVDIGGAFTSVDPFGSTNVTVNGLNDLGQIVGFYTDANSNTVGFVGTATPEPYTSSLAGAALLAVGLLGIRRRRSS
jgi:MYXO-CTERM domain-containing protein